MFVDLDTGHQWMETHQSLSYQSWDSDGMPETYEEFLNCCAHCDTEELYNLRHTFCLSFAGKMIELHGYKIQQCHVGFLEGTCRTSFIGTFSLNKNIHLPWCGDNSLLATFILFSNSSSTRTMINHKKNVTTHVLPFWFLQMILLCLFPPNVPDVFCLTIRYSVLKLYESHL